jgi:DNA-binding NtrC family response regulator
MNDSRIAARASAMPLGNRHTLIALSEDIKTLREIEEILAGQFHIVATRAVERAINLSQADSAVAAIVVDHQLSGSNGLTVLKTVQAGRPGVRRVMVALPANLADIIEGLHCGAVERILYKPLRSTELLTAVAFSAEAAQRATA